jgi:hypothetical protein
MIQIHDVAQNTPEWAALRAGRPTASEFSSILAKGEGKTRAAYMRRLAGEIVTGEPGETFTSPVLDRGHAMEADARARYAFERDVDPQLVGFITNGPKGCSPDALIGENGILEIKSKRADLLIETLLKNEAPPEHKAQCQGALWIAEREWIDLAIYWPKMPMPVFRLTRDEAYIANLSSEVDRFIDELATMVEKIRAYGSKT